MSAGSLTSSTQMSIPSTQLDHRRERTAHCTSRPLQVTISRSMARVGAFVAPLAHTNRLQEQVIALRAQWGGIPNTKGGQHLSIVRQVMRLPPLSSACPVQSLAAHRASMLLPIRSTGSHQPSEGQSKCVPCPVGKYQPNLRAVECLTSPSGRFTELAGATMAAMCAPGVTGLLVCAWWEKAHTSKICFWTSS